MLIPSYVNRFIKLKKNSNISIKLGAEIDFFLYEKGKIKEFIKKYPFDFILGSVHFIENLVIDNPFYLYKYLKENVLKF